MTSRASRCPRWRTGSRSGPSCGSARSSRMTWSPGCWAACRRRGPTRRPPVPDQPGPAQPGPDQPGPERPPGPGGEPGMGGAGRADHESAATVPLRWDLSRHARRLLTLAVAGLGIALVTRRPEFAGAAAPAVLLLAAWRPGRPSHARVTAGLTARRVIEGERAAVTASIAGAGGGSAGGGVAPPRP